MSQCNYKYSIVCLVYNCMVWNDAFVDVYMNYKMDFGFL